MRNASLWRKVVFEKEVTFTETFNGFSPSVNSYFCRHLKAHNLCNKGVLLDYQLNQNVHRYIILGILNGIHQVRILILWQSPKVPSAFKCSAFVSLQVASLKTSLVWQGPVEGTKGPVEGTKGPVEGQRACNSTFSLDQSLFKKNQKNLIGQNGPRRKLMNKN